MNKNFSNRPLNNNKSRDPFANSNKPEYTHLTQQNKNASISAGLMVLQSNAIRGPNPMMPSG